MKDGVMKESISIITTMSLIITLLLPLFRLLIHLLRQFWMMEDVGSCQLLDFLLTVLIISCLILLMVGIKLLFLIKGLMHLLMLFMCLLNYFHLLLVIKVCSVIKHLLK